MKNPEQNYLGSPDNTRERVDKLRETDLKHENSVEELAHREGRYREKLAKHKEELGEDVEELANDFSNESLSAIEASKEGLVDKLTGIGNRKKIDEAIPEILEKRKKNNEDCAVLMIDVDNFKPINDVHGHLTGDTILKSVAKTIEEDIREDDSTIYRYGGDEFLVLCSNADLDGAKVIAERIQKKIKSIEKINDDIDITISVGGVSTKEIEEWQEEGKDNKEILRLLIEKADTALYVSKENGRNQITMYSEDLPEKVKK